MELSSAHIAVIGLGYVGLPLAVEFGRHYPTVGFDINAKRLQDLRNGHDATRETSDEELASAHLLSYSDQLEEIRLCNIYIITVPTPIDSNNQPDLTPLINSSQAIGKVLSPGDLVIYESTVYPGTTEDDCVPVLERESGLRFNQDFFVGYSPERINPGDKERRLTNILKITSGSTEAVADYVDALYQTIITAGTYKAESIRVAEAAKVIENTQRDINIALVNELALIFNKLGIDTEAVLEAAGTKWNFLPFRPGLVGGHCIGVDPYYLAHKAESVGYHPDVIMAGRRINDGMGQYVATQLMKEMMRQRIHVNGAKVLIMGFAFKENCPDLRNTRVIDIVRELESLNVEVVVYDPWVSTAEAQAEYGLQVQTSLPASGQFDGIMLAVAHEAFKKLGEAGIRALGRESHIIYDLKYVLPRHGSDLRL